jgi:predicted AAA+ superfamily ATPase
MYQGSHDLARRAIKYTMVGLSFREFLELDLQISLKAYSLSDILQNHMRLCAEIVDTLEAKSLKILPLFKRYLACGYYPYFFELPNEQVYFITLEQNLHTTIEGDLAAIYPHLSGSSVQKLKALLIFIAKSVPFTPNWNDIKNTLEIGDVRTLKTYFKYLEDASLIRSLGKENHKLSHISHPEKIYLDNPNQMHALTLGDHNTGTLRETFFLDLLSLNHRVTLPAQGDFLIDGKFLFEVGGKNKGFKQVAEEKNAYVACDDIEEGVGRKIPLWLFGFLY